MKRIAVIGANGQVGSEVCLFLDEMTNVKPVGICRSMRGAALLERYGIECRVGSPNDARTAGSLLKDCDLVADFSLPRGRLPEIRRASEAIIHSAVTAAPRDAGFVYVSSYMALGMKTENSVARHYLLPRTAYAVAKRFGEQAALHLGRKAGREVFVLRLGQVYGEIQAASRTLMAEATSAPVVIPDCESYSVFAFSIAEGLAHIVSGRENPGRYTVVSSPAWTWREVYEYHCRQRGMHADVRLTSVDAPTIQSALKQAARAPVATGFGLFIGALNQHRDTIAANLLWRAPALENRMLADYRTRRAEAEIQTFESKSLRKPFQIFVGKIQGNRLTSLSDSRLTMEPVAARVRMRLARLIA